MKVWDRQFRCHRCRERYEDQGDLLFHSRREDPHHGWQGGGRGLRSHAGYHRQPPWDAAKTCPPFRTLTSKRPFRFRPTPARSWHSASRHPGRPGWSNRCSKPVVYNGWPNRSLLARAPDVCNERLLFTYKSWISCKILEFCIFAVPASFALSRHSRFYAFGKRMMNVVPSSTDDRTSMVPPCAAMISLEM